MMQVMSLVFYPGTFIQEYRNLTKHNIFAAFITVCVCGEGGRGCLNFIRIKSYSFSKVYLEFYGHEQDKFCAICSKKFFVSNCILHETIVYVYWSSYFDNNLT